MYFENHSILFTLNDDDDYKKDSSRHAHKWQWSVGDIRNIIMASYSILSVDNVMAVGIQCGKILSGKIVLLFFFKVFPCQLALIDSSYRQTLWTFNLGAFTHTLINSELKFYSMHHLLSPSDLTKVAWTPNTTANIYWRPIPAGMLSSWFFSFYSPSTNQLKSHFSRFRLST